MIRRFIAYYKPHRKLFALDMLCALIVAVCDLFYPMITRNIINDYVPNRQIRLLVVWSAALLLIYLLKMGLNYFIQFYGHVVGVRMQADMRRDVFTHLQRLPFSYFDENKTGTIMSKIINDLMDVSELAHHGPEDLFVSTIMIIGSFIMLCTINVPLTLVVFATLPFVVLFAAKKRVKMSRAFTQTRVEVAEVNANLENAISGVRVSRAFTNTGHELDKFQVSNKAFQRAREFAYRAMAEFSSGTGFFTDFLNLVVMFIGGLFTFYGQISVGDYVAYLLFVGMFLSPIKKLIAFVEQYQSGMTGFKRFVELMDTPPEPAVPGEQDAILLQGDIRFEDVSFAYNEGGQVLRHLNLHIRKGTTTALVGPSGGGKTTLCHLIPRFYDLSEGRILIDGIDLTQISREAVRRNVGIVQQDVFLFTGTIRENIAYGRLGATDEEIADAAKKANIHDYILSLPDGYDTYIGERGVKLSGGQKQRISIARVFLKNPPILILDEATSALDNVTEGLIQKALDELTRGRTTLVVAHRLSTIQNADEIVVLTDRGIEEQGSHRRLLAQGGIYAELYHLQFQHLEQSGERD